MKEQKRGSEEKRILYPIRGLAKGEYDEVIPDAYLRVPPVKLDCSDRDMDAMRVGDPATTTSDTTHTPQVSVQPPRQLCETSHQVLEDRREEAPRRGAYTVQRTKAMAKAGDGVEQTHFRIGDDRGKAEEVGGA